MRQVSKDLLNAKKIAQKVHFGQVDKAGIAYFEHVKFVSDLGETLNEKIVGYLHDVIEDSEMTIEGLNEYGFSTDILNAIEAITRKKDESWNKYICRVSNNLLATKVKLNDLTHNSDLTRITSPKKVDYDRLAKYKKAIAKLEKVINETNRTLSRLN